MQPASSPHQSETRFSNRVADYVRWRPSYPPAILSLLEREAGLTKGTQIADIGSGTGIATGLFLNHGCETFAVEPNAAMRAAAEAEWGQHPLFHSIAGSAEATTLESQSMDLVVSAQAFHWFDHARARQEFSRILRPGGQVVLLWNERHLDTTPFLRDYELFLIRHATDYGSVRHELCGPAILDAFYGKEGYRTHTFPNQQTFDFEGLKGRLLSSSYAPAAGQPGHEPMLQELRTLFETHQQNGVVHIDYTTRVYLGH